MRTQRGYNAGRALTACKWLIHQGLATLVQREINVAGWNTLQVEGLVIARSCRFKSCLRHSFSGQGFRSTNLPLAFSRRIPFFCDSSAVVAVAWHSRWGASWRLFSSRMIRIIASFITSGDASRSPSAKLARTRPRISPAASDNSSDASSRN